MSRIEKQLQNAGPLLTMEQTRRLAWLGSGNDLFCVKCWVHILSGSSGSAVDERTRNELYAREVLGSYCIFSGSFGSAVDERTRNSLYDAV